MTTMLRRGVLQLTLIVGAFSVGACADRALGVPSDGGDDVFGDAFLHRGDLAGVDQEVAPYCGHILVLSDTGELSYFDTTSHAFSHLSQLSCSAMGTGAYSIALDRNGKALAEYVDGELFEVDTSTGACTQTGFVVNQQMFPRFDMTFSSDAQGNNEALYASATLTKITASLAKIDPMSYVLTKIGPLPSNAELTATDAGDLWGFFRGTSPHAGRIDKTTAKVGPDFQLDLGDISSSGIAFSFFDGAFYVFLLDQEGSTAVFSMSPADGSLTNIAQSTGQRIISATGAACPMQ